MIQKGCRFSSKNYSEGCKFSMLAIYVELYIEMCISVFFSMLCDTFIQKGGNKLFKEETIYLSDSYRNNLFFHTNKTIFDNCHLR